MKFLIAKSGKIFCFHCGNNLTRGDHYVGIFYKKNFNGRTIRNRLFFHIECYRKWIDESFVRRYLGWQPNLIPPKKRGRPRKYINSKLANNLNTQLRIARKVGNETKAKELEELLLTNKL